VDVNQSAWPDLTREPMIVAASHKPGRLVQTAGSGADRQANRLPAPKRTFNPTMRLYAPKSEALTGK
jgi:hypothetical protein